MTKNRFHKQLKNFYQLGIGTLAMAIIPTMFSLKMVKAAETIDFSYGVLGFTIKVDSLELFAKEGKIDRQLNFYLSRVSPEARDKFRQALLQKEEVNPVQMYRFLKTPIGEKILIQVGNLINFPGGRNGKYGIRAALGKAAFDSEGLSLLNFLRQFPTDIELNTKNILEVRKLVELLVKGTERMEQEIANLSFNEAANSKSIDFSQLPDLRLSGEYDYIKETITLNDTGRQRRLIVDIYKPQKYREGKIPVIVASHGLGSNREHFEKEARHLASKGYLFVVPQHPGSDSTYIEEMMQGYHRSTFELNEFIDRPLDISYVLDELEKRNSSTFEGRLNLSEVGLVGHSFGGYTALAIAGAEINFEQLEKDCDKVIWDPNLSLLLQCQALSLSGQSFKLHDSRVKAIFLANPLSRSIFGAKEIGSIKIPVFITAGKQDAVTPAAIEQVRPFTFLGTSQRHLALLKGKGHVDISQLDGGAMRALQSFEQIKFINEDLFYNYSRAMITAFFEYYIGDNQDYQPYLQPAYAEYLSEEPFPFYLIGDSSVEALEQAINDFIAEEGLQDMTIE